MKVWILDCDVNNYNSLKFKNGFDLDLIHSFQGESKKDTWRSPKFERMNNRPFSNSPGLSSHIPVMDEEAVNVLNRMIEENAELLPLDCPCGTFFAVNVVRVLDCLDLNKSEFKSFSDGRIMRMIKYSFFEEKINEINLFKVKGLELKRPFVSDRFKKAVEDNHLKGFVFTLAWDSEKEDSAEQFLSQEAVTPKEDLKSQKEKIKMATFEYVENVSSDWEKKIVKTIRKIEHNFSVKDSKEGGNLAENITYIMDNILVTGNYPKKYDGMYEVAKALGLLYGYAISLEYGWKFEKLGSFKGNTKLSVVSPKEGYSIQLTDYIYKILSKKNIGPDGNNDNTVLLLFNMIANLNEEKSECKYSPLS